MCGQAEAPAAEKKRKLPPALQSGLAISNDAAAVPQAAKRNRMGDRRGFGRKICPEPSCGAPNPTRQKQCAPLPPHCRCFVDWQMPLSCLDDTMIR